MTHQEVLTEAIAKVIERGWNGLAACQWRVDGDDADTWVWRTIGERSLYPLFAASIIFDPTFARALWGDKPCMYGLPIQEPTDFFVWFKRTRLHLQSQPLFAWNIQQMVVADDAFAYLAEHLND